MLKATHRTTLIAFATVLALGAALGLLVALESRQLVEVTTDPPGASVFIDGRFVGVTPTIVRDVTPGRHLIRVHKKGYTPQAQALNVARGRQAVHLPLARLATGTLLVTSEPTEAQVFLDGERVGTTPARLTEVPVGTHDLHVHKAGYASCRQTIEVKGDGEQSLEVKLIGDVVAHYLAAIRKAPQDIANYSELARVYFIDGDLGRAADVIFEAVRAACEFGQRPAKGFGEILHKILWARVGPGTLRWPERSRVLLDIARSRPRDMNAYGNVRDLLRWGRRWSDILSLCRIAEDARTADPRLALWHAQAAGNLGDQAQVEAGVKKLLVLLEAGQAKWFDYPQLRDCLGSVGRWNDVIKIADAVLAKQPDRTDVRLWRLQAAMHAGNWRLVADEFDLAMEPGALTTFREPYRSYLRSRAAVIDAEGVLWAGALAKLQLNHCEAVDQILRPYEASAEQHPWVNIIRGEQWLGSRKGQPPKRALHVAPCSAAPEIDGHTDEPVWKTTAWDSKFYEWRSMDPSVLGASICALYDESHLYFAIQCDESQAIQTDISADEVQGGVPAATMGIELFIDADRGYSVYKQSVISFPDTREDYDCMKDPFCRVPAVTTWAPPYRFCMSTDPARHTWYIELALPFTMFGVEPPKPGSAWSFNVVCCGSRQAGTNASFVPVYGSFHQPARFALLLFE